MSENTTQQNTEIPVVHAVKTAPSKEASAGTRGSRPLRSAPRSGGGAKERGGGKRSGAPSRKGGSPRGGGRATKTERARPEFDSKMIQIRRVTRVVSGGRRFSFSVAVVAGNRKGSVGVGVGKAADTSLAIEKALKDAKKNVVKVPLSNEMMIPHGVEAKYTSARVMIMPAPGRGMVAGSSVRNVLELAGIKNVNAKILSGSKNKLNNARAAVEALRKIRAKNMTASTPQ
ncbi:MAG: 30S ribosomal protein S5 [Candidatus Yonathbacteria bacterium]|nr:30S ribosomal protein S5 [Candidatus Yonathbacteria bacterium]